MSTQDYQSLSSRVDNIEKLVNQIERGQREGLEKLFKEIDSLKHDNSITIEGDVRHGVKPVREIAEDALRRSEVVERRIDHILWLVAGISLGAGVGGATIVKIIFGL